MHSFKKSDSIKCQKTNMTYIFGFPEAAAVVAISTFVFMQLVDMNRQFGTQPRWYTGVKKPAFFPPAWLFPIVWNVLYAMLTVTAFYFIQNTAADSWQLIAGLVLFFVHMIANKLWSVYWWTWQSPRAALILLLFVMLPTASGFIVCATLDQTGNSLFVVPLVLFAVYTAWLVYALLLNIYWVFMLTGDDL